jgi:hypothetical protein
MALEKLIMDEITANRKALKEALDTLGGSYLLAQIDERIRLGWDEFIALPVAQKTSKAAFNYQARYDVLKDLRHWISQEIDLADAQ